MTFTLVPSDWTPLTNDLANGVTTFFDEETDGTDDYPNESGQLVIFDNTPAKVLFELNAFNTSTTEMDNAVSDLVAYAADSYSIEMSFSWLASEVTADNSVGWCF